MHQMPLLLGEHSVQFQTHRNRAALCVKSRSRDTYSLFGHQKRPSKVSKRENRDFSGGKKDEDMVGEGMISTHKRKLEKSAK